MTPNAEADLYRTLGNLETGLENLVREVSHANTLSEARASRTEARVSALESLRDRVAGGFVVVMGAFGCLWAVVKVFL